MNQFNNFNRQHNPNEIYVPATHAEQTGLNRHVTKVFGWTFLGLLTTALTVMGMIWGLANEIPIFFDILQLGIMLSVAQIVLVMVLAVRIQKMRPSTAKLLYLTYSASMGIMFTWLALTMELMVLGQAFAITAGSFGIMAVYGVVTKQDLLSYGRILTTAIIGLLIASLVNMFMDNDLLDMLISVSGVFIFLAFVVYDSAKIKHMYAHSLDASGQPTALTENLAVFSALQLYLNFINLFMFVLRLLNRGRD